MTKHSLALSYNAGEASYQNDERQIRNIEFGRKIAISCYLWKIKSNIRNVNINGNRAICGFDLGTFEPVTISKLNQKLYQKTRLQYSADYNVSYMFQNTRWDPIRKELAGIFAPDTLNKQEVYNVDNCAVFGVKQGAKLKPYRCGKPFCPDCGRYDHTRHAKKLAKLLWSIVNSHGYREAAEAGRRAVVHWTGTLPPIVSSRIRGSLLSILEQSNGSQWGKAAHKKSLEIAAKEFINSVTSAHKQAADKFITELFSERIEHFDYRNQKAWYTPSQYPTVHLIAESDVTVFEPHVHGILPGLVGSTRDSKKGTAPGVSMIHNWPNLSESEYAKARNLWAKTILKELVSAGVYSIQGDEPDEFVVRFIPIENPTKEEIQDLCCYTHRSHWVDILNSMQVFAMPRSCRVGLHPVAYFECHRDVYGRKTMMSGVDKLRVVYHRKVVLDEAALLFLRLISGSISRIDRSQTYGGLRDKGTLESIGVQIQDEPISVGDEFDTTDTLQCRFRSFIKKGKAKGKGWRFGQRREYCVKNIETGEWPEWRECNPNNIVYVEPWQKARTERTLTKEPSDQRTGAYCEKPVGHAP